MSTDTTTGSKLVSVPLAGGGSVEIPMLSPAGIVEVAERLQDRRKEQAVRNLRESGFERKAMLKTLNTLDATPVRLGDIIGPLAQDAWLQGAVVAVAMRGRDGTPAVMSIPSVAAELLNCRLVESPEDDPDGANPFVKAPAEQSLSASSTETPDESEPSTA
jgi:hypothetical protein